MPLPFSQALRPACGHAASPRTPNSMIWTSGPHGPHVTLSRLALNVLAYGTSTISSPVRDHHDLTPVTHHSGEQPAHHTDQYGSEDGSPHAVYLETFHEQ